MLETERQPVHYEAREWTAEKGWSHCDWQQDIRDNVQDSVENVNKLGTIRGVKQPKSLWFPGGEKLQKDSSLHHLLTRNDSCSITFVTELLVTGVLFA